MMIDRRLILASWFSRSEATGLPLQRGIPAVDLRGPAFEIDR